LALYGEKHPKYKPELHIPRPCACGCGEMVVGAKDGRLKRFRKGHWARVHNPMKNPATVAKFKRENHVDWKEPGTRRKSKSRDGLYYWLVKLDNGEWAYEHRHIMEQKLGRKLKKEEHIHHLNGDTLDNRPENLAVILHSDHSKVHCPFPNAPRRDYVNGEVVVV